VRTRPGEFNSLCVFHSEKGNGETLLRAETATRVRSAVGLLPSVKNLTDRTGRTYPLIMHRRQVLKTLAGVTGLGGGAAQGLGGKQPNILFLMTDEHRADSVGYMNPLIQTPHLDRLAEQSVVFTNAYSTSPSCVPARAAIYTGRYPSQCGAPTYITYLPASEITFMERLQSAGYYTAAIGKQHFGESGVRHGYDYEDLVDVEGGAAGSTSYLKMLRAGDAPKQLRKPAGRFVSTWTAEQRFHIDDFVGEQAKVWLRDRCPRGRPWFATVSFHGPHQPFDGLGLSYERLYAGKRINLPETNASHLSGKPPHFGAQKSLSGDLSEEDIRRMRLSYYSKISMIDEKIGGILTALKERGEYDNTLIVFTADHGDFMGDFGLVYKAQYLSEVLMRIPLLAKPPIAGFQGRRESAFVQNFDIAPTCLALSGARIPPDMSAQDLSPFWRSPEAAPRRQYCFMDGHGLQGVRDERWKLVHYRDREYGEFYDLRNDPWEKKNLWNESSLAPIKARLQGALLNHLTGITRRSEAEWNDGAPKI
jgi:arylsulfatase